MRASIDPHQERALMKVMMVGATGPNAGLVLPALTAAGVTSARSSATPPERR
jgi:hypothetical protein